MKTEDSNNLLVNKDYEWTLRVIRSCETIYQLECCDNVVNIFLNRHPDFNNLGDVLRSVLDDQKAAMREKDIKDGLELI